MINSTSIDGCYTIDLLKFSDYRGNVLKLLHSEISKKFNFSVSEVFFTNTNKDVIRAMHLQTNPNAVTKIVYCVSGVILDVLLDIRPSSPTFKKTFDIILNSEEHPIALYIPEGVAHGYKVNSDKSTVLYLQSGDFVRESDAAIRYDSFGFDWKIDNPILSDKDKNAKTLEDFLDIVL